MCRAPTNSSNPTLKRYLHCLRRNKSSDLLHEGTGIMGLCDIADAHDAHPAGLAQGRLMFQPLQERVQRCSLAGLLFRLRIVASSCTHIGKEANDLAVRERGLVSLTAAAEAQQKYTRRDCPAATLLQLHVLHRSRMSRPCLNRPWRSRIAGTTLQDCYLPDVKPERAIAELRSLRAQVDNEAIRRSTPEHKAWKASVAAVLRRSLGDNSDTVSKFSSVSYHIGIWSGAPGEAERDAKFFAKRVDDAAALIDAAIYELGLLSTVDSSEQGSCDPDLWAHVRHSVEEERWDQVASSAATFVEDKIRRWSNDSRDAKGGKLVGTTLFAHALSDAGPLALGGQANETLGWRNLGIGFTAALGNVDRHNIQDRVDLKMYATGTLGLASLLLTQIKYEHPDST